MEPRYLSKSSMFKKLRLASKDCLICSIWIIMYLKTQNLAILTSIFTGRLAIKSVVFFMNYMICMRFLRFSLLLEGIPEIFIEFLTKRQRFRSSVNPLNSDARMLALINCITCLRSNFTISTIASQTKIRCLPVTNISLSKPIGCTWHLVNSVISGNYRPISLVYIISIIILECRSNQTCPYCQFEACLLSVF